jgi:YD repeat-containing protein
MRQKFLLLLILLLLPMITNAQGKSDIQKEGLLGKVRTQLIEQATLSPKPDGSIEELRKFSSLNFYDNNGNCVDGIGAQLDGTKFGNRIFYDANGREIERHFLDANEAMTAKSYSFYNPKGQRMKTVVYCGDAINHTLSFSYDKKGNQIEEIVHHPALETKSKALIFYDDHANEIERRVYKTDGTLSRTYIYTYDDKGRRLSWILYDEQKVPIIHWVHTYNEKGDLKETFYYNRQGVLYMKEAFSYEYDRQGNWIKKQFDIEKFKDGQTVSEVLIIYRKLTYY